ncbi:MAG TPA: DNA polymerase III subunit alpha [Candidatus Dormibacteraeota bacterium]
MQGTPETGEEIETGGFVHLHTHSEFSLLDGMSRVTELIDTAKAMGQTAVAITDHGVLYGAVDFYSAARAAKINPIIGCEMYMAPRARTDREGRADRDPNHLILLARNDAGYRNLIKLVSASHLEGYYYKPRIDRELLAEHAEGLICLSACLGGELPQAIVRGDLDAAEAIARQHAELFGPDNYFLELQDHGIPEEDIVRAGLVEIARRTGLPLVATNDSHYIRPEDAEAHDILLCLQTGARREEEKRFRLSGPDYYLASTRQMRERFAAYGEAVSNTVAIADRCHVEIPLGRNLLPTYSPIPEGLNADTYLLQLCEVGVQDRYADAVDDVVRERLSMELDVIRETGFSAYFLIVWDLIKAARTLGVRVGPGRGSAAGSVVSYVLHITDIEPLQYGLIFERFLNRERVQMPDIDIDFDDRGRDRVLTYVQEKYGRDRVAQIITFGTMAARAAIRDVGRVLNIPLPDVDRLAKLVPQVVNITLDRALVESRELRELYQHEDWARHVIDNARRLEGICRNASTHAAGVVIGSEPLANIVPLQRSTIGDGTAVTQFDMNGVSKIGLLKIDFLGLSNLTVIAEAVETIRATRGIDLDIDHIQLDDAKTYELLGKADTHGIFQLEATFAKRILIDMQPNCLADMGVAVALNRPGPIEGGATGMWMRRKRGEEAVTYMLPELEPILKETYGAILYQDQVMKIASAVAGFSLGEADILRAAMGKKDKVKMAKQREQFLSGAAARGVAAETALELFELIALFAGYGFNGAHSISYGLIAYQTAYLKANYPREYMSALLNSRADNFDRLKQSILDAHARGLVVRPPDVNRSTSAFSLGDEEQGEILYGLRHIKNVGERVAAEIVAEREASGPFVSLFDLCLRVSSRDLNRRVVEALIRSGACDSLGERGAMLAVLDRAIDRANTIRRERESGQTSLFGETVVLIEPVAPPADDFDGRDANGPNAIGADERLSWEREFLGIYLSDHPLRRIAGELQERVDTTMNELGGHLDGLIVQVGGAIRDMRTFIPRRSTTGQRMASLTIEDLTGSVEVVVFARIFEECANVLRPDAVVVVRGKVEAGRSPNGGTPPPIGEEDDRVDVEPPQILAEAVYAYDDPRLAAWRRDSTVHVNISARQIGVLGSLRRAFEEHHGDCPVVLHVDSGTSVDEISLAVDFSVDPGPALERAIEILVGENSYRLEMHRVRAPERERAPARR